MNAPADLARQPAGRVVRLDGFTDPGDFAPMIHADRVTPVGGGRLPPAPRHGYDDLIGGRADSQWVEVEAVVRGAGRDSWGNACLLLRFGPATVPAVVAGTDPAALAGLFGATARVRASVGSTFNDRRQWSGLALYVPGPDAVEVRTPAPGGFADLPARTVESLSYFDPARGPRGAGQAPRDRRRPAGVGRRPPGRHRRHRGRPSVGPARGCGRAGRGPRIPGPSGVRVGGGGRPDPPGRAGRPAGGPGRDPDADRRGRVRGHPCPGRGDRGGPVPGRGGGPGVPPPVRRPGGGHPPVLPGPAPAGSGDPGVGRAAARDAQSG